MMEIHPAGVADESRRDDVSSARRSRHEEPNEPQPSASITAPHLPQLDGLRGGLALWVVVCHVMWAAGYERDELHGALAVLREGAYAVDLFVVLSGFVICLLLDRRRESYTAFITRRFMRLFPAYVLLFIAAIPVSRIAAENLALGAHYLTAAHLHEVSGQIAAWWRHANLHTLLHLTMLHGIVPRTLLPEAPGAFLEPAWSISLEWQFYLVAPLVYAALTSREPRRRVFAHVAMVGLFVLAALGKLPRVDFGAALPFHIEYFYIGAASYFVYRRNLQSPLFETPLLGLGSLAVFLVALTQHGAVIPLCLWLLFLGLLLEAPRSPWSRTLERPLVHPAAQFIGRRSYGLYLCHMPLLECVHRVILQVAPRLGRGAHFASLLGGTLLVSLPAAALIYTYVESPGIRLGHQLASRSRLRERELLA
ncbi:MAG: acyltransferase [Polyangiales bacterium]